MYIVINVGRRSGEIADLPFHIATGMIEAGTARRATDHDLANANIEVKADEPPKPDAFPEGYTTEPDPEYGINLFAPDDLDKEFPIEGSPFRNMVQARLAAHLHLEANSEKPKSRPGRPVGGSKEAAAAAQAAMAPPPPPGA